MPNPSVMKTAEEWRNEYFPHNLAKVEVIRAIQRDALEAAATELEKMASEIRTYEMRVAYRDAARVVRSLLPPTVEPNK